MSRLRWIGGISQAQWVVIAMIIGVSLGWAFPDRPGAGEFRASDLQVLSNVFLRLIKSLVAPLLFATLVVGIAGHGDDMKRVGTLAVRSLIYFEVVTVLALAVGLVAVNVAQPGSGVTLGTAGAVVGAEPVATRPGFASALEHIVPQSFVDAAARGDALQITFFSIVFAVAVAHVRGPAKALLLAFCQALADVMFKFTALVMRFAPIGVGGAIAATVGKSGIGVLRHLGALVVTL